MAPKKLTEADKKVILKLYRQPEETTSTLAGRYGVSNSTISRLLKAKLPEAEYSDLIQQKRNASVAHASEKSTRAKTDLAPASTDPGVEEVQEESSVPPKAVTQPKSPASRRKATQSSAKSSTRRKRSSPKTPVEPVQVETEPLTSSVVVPDFEETAADPLPTTASSGKAAPKLRQRQRPQGEELGDEQLTLPTSPEPEPVVSAMPKLKSVDADQDSGDDDDETGLEVAAWVDESLDDADDWESDSDDDEDDEDDEDDDEDDDDWDRDPVSATPHLQAVEISPLTADVLPGLCYVIVERTSSELVVLPLRTFAELGQIPEAESESRTLPVFDNHRIARRFSRRNQRVVKVPNGVMLYATSPYLQAKGITRLLIDGQVYALQENDGGSDLKSRVEVED